MFSHYNSLSKQEQYYFNIISKIGCLTVQQSKTILNKYLSCSDAQATRILQSLKHRQYITISDDNIYVTAGAKSNPNRTHPSPKMIRIMHLCINLVDDLNNMLFAHIPSDGTDLVFLADGKMYKIIELRENELYKVNVLQESYKDTQRVLHKQEPKKGSTFTYTTIFCIPSSERHDKIMEFFNNEEIHFPVILAFYQQDGITDAPKYELFTLNMDAS